MKQGVLVVLGHKGSGKSQLTRKFLKQVPRSVCLDTMGEYGGVVIEDPYSLAEYLEANRRGGFRIAYRDNGQHEDIKPETLFKMLGNLRETWLCLEEASKYGEAGNSNRMIREARWFIQYGRHYGISVLLVARRPQEIDRMATANADTVVSFVQQEPRDLDYIRQLGGVAAEERIKRLGLYEWDYVVDQHDGIHAVLSSISTGESNVGSSDSARLDSDAMGDGGNGARRDGGVVPETEQQGNEGARARNQGSRSSGVVPESGEAVVGGENVNP